MSSSQFSISKEEGDRIPDEAWEFESMSSDGMRASYIAWIDRENGTYVRKTVNLIEPDLIKQNQDELFESQNKRFGDWTKAASVPLNVFYQELAPRLKEGDKDFTKWFLNHPDKKMWRTFRGKV